MNNLEDIKLSRDTVVEFKEKVFSPNELKLIDRAVGRGGELFLFPYSKGKDGTNGGVLGKDKISLFEDDILSAFDAFTAGKYFEAKQYLWQAEDFLQLVVDGKFLLREKLWYYEGEGDSDYIESFFKVSSFPDVVSRMGVAMLEMKRTIDRVCWGGVDLFQESLLVLSIEDRDDAVFITYTYRDAVGGCNLKMGNTEWNQGTGKQVAESLPTGLYGDSATVRYPQDWQHDEYIAVAKLIPKVVNETILAKDRVFGGINIGRIDIAVHCGSEKEKVGYLGVGPKRLRDRHSGGEIITADEIAVTYLYY